MMQTEPLISVIIPVYNVEKYIQRSIESIQKQTYQNLQIIIVDDCSTDKTFPILEKIKNQDERIVLLKNETNSKIVHSLNYALKFAKGDYIARMDGDDISSNNRIEMLFNFLKENKEYSLVGSNVYTINESSEIIGCNNFAISEKVIDKTLKYNSPILHIWLAHRKVYEQLKGYRNIPGVEDYDFLLRMKSVGLKFTNIPYYLYSVRIRSGNTNDVIGFEQRLMHKYVYNLYKNKISFGSDDILEGKIKEYIKTHENLRANYLISSKYQKKYIFYKGRNSFLSLFYLFLSLSRSSLHRDYLASRLIFKFFCLFAH